jgi:hypothetical protein
MDPAPTWLLVRYDTYRQFGHEGTPKLHTSSTPANVELKTGGWFPKRRFSGSMSRKEDGYRARPTQR